MARDIYFDKKYGKLYEKAENGTAVCWQYDGPEGCVSHQFLLRKIPISTDNGPWYDIITPYGYGGPLIESVAEGSSQAALVAAFEQAFSDYCIQNCVVSEFVRFHPIVDNARDFAAIYNPQCFRHTLGTDLANFDDPIAEEFSKSCRKNIRRAINKGVSWRVTPQPECIDVFKEIYYSTMDRNNASEYYYFDDEYFARCLNWFRENLLFVEAVFEEKTIAAGLYFIYGDTLHIHLSGTLSEYLYLSPAYVLRYAATLWGKENGCKCIHHGGGRSNAPDDNLFVFKKQFAQKTEFSFFVGRKVWNQTVYDKLTALSGKNPDAEFFPAYRA